MKIFRHEHPKPLLSLLRSRWHLCACLLTAFSYSTASWALVDTPVLEATQALQAKQAQKAFDALSPLESSRAGDPDFDLVLGIAANEIHQFPRAIFALERVLLQQPDNARARTELARAMFAVGDSTNARKLLLEAKTQGLPDHVGRNIDSFLQAIEKTDDASRSKLKLHFELGLGYDGNINSGPSQTSFAVPALGGLVVTLQPTGQRASSHFLHLGAGVSGRAVVAPRWSLIGQVNATGRSYANRASDFDTHQIDASGGMSYRDERHEFAGVLNLSQTDLDGKALRRITGLTGEWTYRPDGMKQWGTYLQVANLDYPNQSSRDAKRVVLGTSFAHQFGINQIYFMGGYAGQENVNNSAVPQLDQKLIGLRAGLQWPLAANWSTFATVSLENRRFGGTDPLFLTVRRDTQLDAALGITWAVTDRWSLKPQINLSRSNSNIVINKYNKTSANLISRFEF